jgi:hypothetical protein
LIESAFSCPAGLILALFLYIGVVYPFVYVVAEAFCWALLDGILSGVPSNVSIVFKW